MIKGKTVYLYINNKASGIRNISRLLHRLLRHVLPFETVITRQPRTKEKLVSALRRDLENAANDPVYYDSAIFAAAIFAAAGGDGTHHLMIQELKNSKAVLLPLPGGAGNDLSCQAGWYPLDRKSCGTYSVRLIDTIEVNGRVMATNGGCGCVAHVIRLINLFRSKSRCFEFITGISGKWIYFFSGLVLLFSSYFRLSRYTLSCNGFERKVKAVTIWVVNQPLLGGIFRLSHTASNNDGIMELVILKHKSRLRFLFYILGCVFHTNSGANPGSSPDIEVIRTKEAVITCRDTKGNLFFGDGESFPVSPNRVWNISLKADALAVLTRHSLMK